MSDEFNNADKIMGELNIINHSAIQIGVLDESGEFLQMIAIVNNDGTTIRAKNKPYLMIPYKKSDGTTGYFQKKEVSIPARRFLERTIKVHGGRWSTYAAEQIPDLIDGSKTAMGIMRNVGELAVKQMQSEITKFKVPHNAPLTVANKGFDDPLIDTGALRDTIAYEIVPA